MLRSFRGTGPTTYVVAEYFISQVFAAKSSIAWSHCPLAEPGRAYVYHHTVAGKRIGVVFTTKRKTAHADRPQGPPTYSFYHHGAGLQDTIRVWRIGMSSLTVR